MGRFEYNPLKPKEGDGNTNHSRKEGCREEDKGEWDG